MRNLTNRPIGHIQKHVLERLAEWGPWRPGCGWVWDTRLGTQRILDSLNRRGLVRKLGEIYIITPKGKMAAK